MTIRTKLAIWYSVLVAVILILLGGARYAGYRQMLQDQKDYSLKVVADVLDSALPDKAPSKDEIKKAVAEMFWDYPDLELKGILVEVYDASQKLLFSSSVTEGERLPITEEMWQKGLRRETGLVTLKVQNNTAPMRILTKPVFHWHRLLYLTQVGSSTQDIESTLENFLFFNLIFIPMAAVLVGVGGWWLTRKALKPLDGVIQTAHRIGSGDLSHRIEAPRMGVEIRKLADAFNQMISRLETSFIQIRDFSANVSHELRIPLSILRGQTELSLRRPRSNAEYQQILESNLEEILRMEKVVERLLFLAKADRGEITLSCEPVELSHLMESVYKQFQLLAGEKKLHLRLKTSVPCFIEGDELLLRDLLLNLVQNAVTFTPEGGAIEMLLDEDPQGIRMSITDTGCGIPENEIPRIFDRFYQVEKSHANQGSGLGLSICQWIVEAHRGAITVESTVGKGSRFTVGFRPKEKSSVLPAGVLPD
jgi:heavy metal sensor kinase